MTIQAESTDITVRPWWSHADWRYPAPNDAGFCYACWYTHFADYRLKPADCVSISHPRDLSWPLATITVRGLRELGVPDLSGDWHPAHTATVRALIAELQERVDLAERMAARTAENA